MANILLVQSFIPSRRFALISIKKGELILILSLSIDKKRTITPFRLSFAARRRAGQEIRNRKEKENIGKHSILRTIDRFFIFHMFIDYRKLFAHLLSNFDLDLYKSILFIVISKIIKYTFFEIRFLEFTFRISFFPKYSLVEYLLFQKKKKGRNSFLRIWQLNASNIDSLIFRRGEQRNSEFDQLLLHHSRYSKLLLQRYENLAWKTYEF